MPPSPQAPAIVTVRHPDEGGDPPDREVVAPVPRLALLAHEGVGPVEGSQDPRIAPRRRLSGRLTVIGALLSN